jgi:hypothetical protein
MNQYAWVTANLYDFDLSFPAFSIGGGRLLLFAVYEGVPEWEKPESGPRNDGQKQQQLIIVLQTEQGEQVVETELSQDSEDNENNECQPSFHFIMHPY